MTESVIRATGVTKIYPGVVALKDAALELYPGEIHAVMGENGSGKSTFLSLIAGSQEPTAGELVVFGEARATLTPKKAKDLGIALVQQEPQLAPALTVGENIMLGRLPGRGGVSWRAVHRQAQALLDGLGFGIDSKAPVSSLSTGRRQLVEVAKALVVTPRVLLLDEATSSLDEADVIRLVAVLERLRDEGVAIAFISHRMKEVMEIADRATVLRDGRYVGATLIADTNERALVAMMVGRDLADYWHKAEVDPGSPVLEIQGLTRGHLRDIDLTVRSGEVVGIAGLVGSGRSAILRTIMGTRKAKRGVIKLDGTPVQIRSPRDAHRLGIGYVPEDRKAEGLVMGWSILRNAALALMNERGPLSFITKRFDREAYEQGSRGLRIKASSPEQIVSQLSGGNQQKVVIARELATKPRVLLLDEPTRGVDVGAKEDIYAEIAELVSQGMGLLVVSSELPELLGVCDRIYVMFHGRIVAEFSADEATEELIAYQAAGAHEVATAEGTHR
ncbi:sugar ABC transporter ATP-binding protein [Microbacterium sp. NPDC055910]|uniref:sugar ABC transporter ATP-binding protein n=1 Tax=Microbacterium sp. NPDC055910 TaxID=3345659 RepID=UPI0035DC8C9B